jgi:N-acyl homoserine lactone hydrolase
VVAMRLYGFSCGSVRLKKKAVVEGGEGLIEMPIPVFLIMHPRGNVLFDTGLHLELADPQSARLGELSKYSTIALKRDEHVTARLSLLGLKPADIAVLVNSHLHYDHAGANDCFAHTRMVVQRIEWEAAHDPDLVARNAYNPADYALNDNVHLIDGEHDLFGDGTIFLTPTFGHTPGHQCACLRIGDRRIVLAGDACYLAENLERQIAPRLSFDKSKALASLATLAAWERGGSEIIIGHDPERWEKLPHAPQPIA